MDRLNSMEIFAAAAKAEGFSAAANRIGLSRASVSKSVMQLEQHLGTRLFNRTTRRISLTEVGQIYLARCTEILNDIAETEAIAAAQSNQARGRLTLSVPTSFGILHLQNATPEYLREHPQVQISLNLADRFIDVVDEGFDLVIRIAELEDSSLIARRLAPCRRLLCASPAYLEEHGWPRARKIWRFIIAWFTQTNCGRIAGACEVPAA